MPRYRTLAELQAAYQTGTEPIAPLSISFDTVSAVEGGGVVSVAVWESSLLKMLDDALELLGIPFEHV